jgi:hypothetical protein
MQAAEDFSKARGKAVLSQIANFINADKDKLLSFNDVKEILKPRGEVYRGMRTVAISLIVGSEGRYRDFNKYFLPRSEYMRKRWERVDEAHLENVTLPPISLYQIGGVYFVRDGNHRVSVAKAQGVEMLDAEVTELTTEINIRPGDTVDELRRAVILYEKDIFYEKTDFGVLTGCFDLDFSMPGRYDVIYNHILVHKYFLNQTVTEEIPFHEALVSWYNNVYDPIIQIIDAEKLLARFPGRSPGDLYEFIVKRWDYLKEKYGMNVPIANAVRDYAQNFAEKKPSLWQRLRRHR